jgi:hypothetical protein
MNSVLPRHFRGLFVAILTLGLSATIVFAGQPSGSTSGLEATAGQADGSEAPDSSEAPEATDAPEASEAPDGSETPGANDPTGSNDNCAIDPTTLAPEQLALMNHGSIVCWAAHQPTPSGYANHGAWVSQWAHMKFDANGQPILKIKHGKSAHHK